MLGVVTLSSGSVSERVSGAGLVPPDEDSGVNVSCGGLEPLDLGVCFGSDPTDSSGVSGSDGVVLT